MNRLLAKIPALLLTLMVGLIASSSAFATATIQILNNDAPNVGFNDPTAVAPVGGNTGTTLGQQRLNALQEAANIWGATLTSGPIIVIRAQWANQACGVLASAGNTGAIWRDFQDSVPGFWYGNALANAIRNTDLNGASVEINATFNLNVGTPTCLPNSPWYYGLDNNHGATAIDLVTVALHEFGHGLGFQTFTSSSSGVQAGGFPTIYDRFLFDNTTGKSWPQMTDAERVTSAKNTRRLAWNGPQVVNDVPSVLALGTPLFSVNSPPAVAGVYPVGTATFGPPLSSPGVTGSLVQALDAADGIGPATTDGCSVLTNPGAISGNIALIDRGPTGGTCGFALKVKNAQDAGATGVVIVNNVAGSPPPGMGGTDGTITIPSLMIALSDGDSIKAQLGSGVSATLTQDPTVRAGADPSGRPLVFTPDPVAGGSSISHWDTSGSPNQLMEPSINLDLFHSVTTPQDLTFSVMRDIGWCAGCPQPPPPSPTPTPSPPPNDNFANAQLIGGCSGSVTGTNVAATEEAGEPNHPDSPTSRKSVWYQWQSPTTASVTIDTIGSNFDTLLAVYTGTTVSALTLVTSNDDIVSGNTASKVTFAATQGTVYRIAVDGFNNSGDGGDTGSITLNWTESNCTFKSKKTGVFRPSTGELFLKNSNSSGFADSLIVFGNPGDYPIAGDWNGDGVDSVGIYRNGIFFLRNTNTTGFADIVVAFGNAGDQPVVGDWNGDGIDTIGVYRNGTFILRNSNTPGPPDLTFTLGNPGDVGITGDWNGDGITTCGVFRPSNGVIFLKNSNTTGFADLSFVYGIASDKPVAGDWNGDGIDSVGIYRNGLFFLTNSNTTGFADTVFALGVNGDFPIAGNWNGSP